VKITEQPAMNLLERAVAFGRGLVGLDEGLGPLELAWDRPDVLREVDPMTTADVEQLLGNEKAQYLRFQQDEAAGRAQQWDDVARRFGCGPQGMHRVFASRLTTLREVLRDRYRLEGEPAWVRGHRAAGAAAARELMKALGELKALDVERRALGSFLDASLIDRGRKATARVRELERDLQALRATLASGGYDAFDPALPADETSGPSAA
jgi:hypothetical protein